MARSAPAPRRRRPTRRAASSPAAVPPTSSSPPTDPRPAACPAASTSSYDEKARRLLGGAAAVFAAKGYHNATMRDIARETGVSLSGIYYYFSGKEELLYSIQRFCFRRVLDSLAARLAQTTDPTEKLRAFLANHLEFFTQNVREMKVLSHESESLSGRYYAEIADMKREYFKALSLILVELDPGRFTDAQRRRATLSVFGMVNWIYTWYDPARDGSAEQVAATMFQLLSEGVVGRQP